MNSQVTGDRYDKNDSIKRDTETIKSSLCDYSDAYISVTGDITVNEGKDTDAAF